MKKQSIVALVMIGLFLGSSMSVQAAARDEVIDYCKRAATVIKQQGIEVAIKKINDPKGPFIWNDGINYVFLMNMKGRMLAHPYKPQLTKMAHVLDYADQDGKLFFADFVKKAGANGRGWVKYKWPLPKTEEILPKFTFIYRIPGTDYFVGSGFYDLGAGVYH